MNDVLFYIFIIVSSLACGAIFGVTACHMAWLWLARNRTEEFLYAIFCDDEEVGSDE